MPATAAVRMPSTHTHTRTLYVHAYAAGDPNKTVPLPCVAGLRRGAKTENPTYTPPRSDLLVAVESYPTLPTNTVLW